MDRRQKEKQQERRDDAKQWANEQNRGFVPTSVKFPDGMKKFSLAKTENGSVHTIDILQFKAGWGNPRADQGFATWVREYSVHRVMMPDGNERPFLCLYKNFGKPCAGCRKLNNDKNLAEDIRVKLFPQPRMLMLVNDKPGDLSNPPKIFDVNYKNRDKGFGEQLVVAARMWKGATCRFSSLDEGLTLQIVVADGKYGSVARIDFEKREYKYPASLLETLPCLDDCLLVPHPKSLDGKALSDYTSDDWKKADAAFQAILDGGDPDQDDEPAPIKKVEVEPTPEQRYEDNGDETTGFESGSFVNYQGKKCEILKFKDGTLTLEDPSGKIHKGVSPADLNNKTTAPELAEDEDEDDLPPPKSSKAPAKVVAKDDDDDDDDDLDDDD